LKHREIKVEEMFVGVNELADLKFKQYKVRAHGKSYQTPPLLWKFVESRGK
jgi:hypothetical protein